MTTPPRHRRSLVAVALALGLVLGACSSGSDDDATTTTSTVAEAATTTDDTAPPDADPGADLAAAPEGEVATADPVPSAGCGTSTVGEVTDERRTLPDSERWYLLTTPAAHDGETPLPLVLDFHGLAEGAQVHSLMSGFGAHAQAEGFVVAFPHGTGEPVRWDVGADRTANPDLVYTDALLDQLEADLCIDTSRVYATGLSNGAFMSSTIACTMSDRVAAVAPVAGVVRPEPCATERPVPVLAYHGTDDPILLFNGGVRTGRLGPVIGGEAESPEEEEPLPEADLDGEGYPAAAAAWAEANGCDAQPVDERRTESILRRSWDCPAEAPVLFEVMEGGGHTWPGSEFSAGLADIMGPTDLTIDGTAEIWDFFQRFALPAA